MYADDLPPRKIGAVKGDAIVNGGVNDSVTAGVKAIVNGTLTPPPTPTSLKSTSNEHTQLPTTGEEAQGDEISGIAKAFAAKVPDDMFSPAEIQGFLLKRKTDPRKALLEVESWVKGMVEVKEKGGKLVKVQ